VEVILSSTERNGDARERLLTRLLDAFGEALPAPEVSLREIAARAETSHALLRYHFGSLPGVLAAMLKAQRSRELEQSSSAIHALGHESDSHPMASEVTRTSFFPPGGR